MRKSSSKKVRDARTENLTTSPVEASPVPGAEFCDNPGAYALFGLRRSALYELHALGLIQGVTLRHRGRARGKRLWNCDSIRSYIASRSGEPMEVPPSLKKASVPEGAETEVAHEAA